MSDISVNYSDIEEGQLTVANLREELEESITSVMETESALLDLWEGEGKEDGLKIIELMNQCLQRISWALEDAQVSLKDAENRFIETDEYLALQQLLLGGDVK